MDQLQQVILWHGLDDWVPLLSVVGAAQAQAQSASAAEAGKARALDAIRDLARAGLVEIGDVTEAGGFIRWNTDLEQSLSRIWAQLNSQDDKDWSFACWLSNTPDGDKLAEQWRGNPPVPGGV